jgi:hypothetical protein
MDSMLSQSSDTDFSSYSNDSSFFDNFKNMNSSTWIIIILVLAFLGFNIFIYLADITQVIVDILNPLLGNIFKTTAVVTGETVDVAAEGAKAVVGGTKVVVNKTADAIETGLTAIQDITPNVSSNPNMPSRDISPNVASSNMKGQSVSQPQADIYSQGDQSTLNKALNTRQMQQPQNEIYQAYEASSSVHSAGKSGKAGWCFIGEDRGFRSCAPVGVSDMCMSGDIFPTHEICMNPNLRT